MTPLEITILNKLYAFAHRKFWCGPLDTLAGYLGFANSRPVRGILRDPKFQAVSTRQGTAIWISASDGKVRVVDTTAVRKFRPNYGPGHCRFCTIPEPVPEADLIEVEGDRVHRQCAKSHRSMLNRKRLREETAARWGTAG